MQEERFSLRKLPQDVLRLLTSQLVEKIYRLRKTTPGRQERHCSIPIGFNASTVRLPLPCINSAMRGAALTRITVYR